MTTDIALNNLFEGKEVRIIKHDNDLYMPTSDLASAWGIARSTPDKIIERNWEVFAYGFSALVVDVTSNTPVRCVSERGLYLMMGKISASRLKNPAAKEAIIRFQRWVPELIQKYRKREIVQLPKEPDYNKILDEIKFAKELSGVVGTEALPLYCRVLEKHDMGDLGGLLVVQKDIVKPALPALPPPKPKKDYLTATDIGERIGKSPHEVNMFLYQHHPPLIVKDDVSDWRLTEYGEGFAEERAHQLPDGCIVWRIKWKKDVLRLFNVYDHV